MSETVAMYLELVAAKAKTLAHDEKNGRLWPTDLEKGINEIREALDKASNESRNSRVNQR